MPISPMTKASTTYIMGRGGGITAVPDARMGAAESAAATAAERRSLRSSSWNETKNAIKWQLAEHADNQNTPKYLTNILKLEQNCCFVICILLPFVLLHSFVYNRYYVYQKQQRRMKHILDITLWGFLMAAHQLFHLQWPETRWLSDHLYLCHCDGILPLLIVLLLLLSTPHIFSYFCFHVIVPVCNTFLQSSIWLHLIN